MATGKKSFTAYCDWINSFESLTDKEAGKLIKHLLRYVNDKDPKAEDRITELCFIPIKDTLKRDLIKWEKRVEANKNNGSKGGRPKNPSKPKKPNGLNGNPSKPKKPDSDTDSDSDSVSDTDSDTKKDVLTEFSNSLKPFLVEYGKEMLNEFYLYWTEKGERARKYRFEKEKTWELSRRLKRWSDNNFNTGSTKKQITPEAIKKHQKIIL